MDIFTHPRWQITKAAKELILAEAKETASIIKKCEKGCKDHIEIDLADEHRLVMNIGCEHWMRSSGDLDADVVLLIADKSPQLLTKAEIS